MIEINIEMLPQRDVFDELARNRDTLRRAEARQLVLIAQACDQWRVDETLLVEGAERLQSGGADGTPHVGQFLCVEVAAILHLGVEVAAGTIADVLDLRDRHPHLWQSVQALDVAPWQARRVTQRCAGAGLSGDAARWVDRQFADALKLMPFKRAWRLLEGLIVKADPALAAERAEAARQNRCVHVGNLADGSGTLFALMDAADAIALDETVSNLATALAAQGEPGTPQQRRARALGLLAEPDRAAALLAREPLPPTRRKATVFVHLAAGAVCDPADPGTIARVEGVGALTREGLIRFLGTGRVIVRPVVDHDAVPPVDSYEIPETMREAVTQRHPAEAFPWSHRDPRTCEVDHTVPYEHHGPPGAGQTRLDNLAPLSRRVHRAKTHGGWKVTQVAAGVLDWLSPHGFRYRVTPHGTTDLGRRGTPLPGERTPHIDLCYPAA